MKILISTDSHQPNDRYRGALLCAGALPEEVQLVKPGETPTGDFDGLLVAGGADVHPSRYGETDTTGTLELSEVRDRQDFALFERAEEKHVPVFGICRGMQMLNVALGGTLWQDLPTQRDRGLVHEYDRREGWDPAHLAHVVNPRPLRGVPTPAGALFASAGEQPVNSRHHQAVKDLAPGLVPLAASPDDLLEAFERPGGPFLLAVQWHPEDLVAQPFQKTLFRSFLAACRERERTTGRAGEPPVQVLLEGRIPVVRLNRPAKKNALAGSMREVLAGTIEALGADPTVPAIILTGAGNAFSAGGDLEVLRALVTARDVEGFRELLDSAARAVLSIVRCPKPVLAAVDGPAAGAGMNLALACDVRVASTYEESAAVFAQSFAAIGLAPDWGGTFHLPLLAGPGAASDLVFSAERISAARARELGLVDVLADDGPALPVAVARAAVYAEQSAAALAAAKKNLNADRLAHLEDALARETEAQIELFRGDDLARRLFPPKPRRPENQEIQ